MTLYTKMIDERIAGTLAATGCIGEIAGQGFTTDRKVSIDHPNAPGVRRPGIFSGPPCRPARRLKPWPHCLAGRHLPEPFLRPLEAKAKASSATRRLAWVAFPVS